MTILDLLHTGQDPKYPGLVLSLHVIAKNVEMGSLLGLALGVLSGSAQFAIRKQNPLIKILQMCELGVCFGTAFGLVTILFKAHKDPTMNADGIYDRAYRLTHNKPGIKHEMDVRFLSGGVVGAAVFGLIVPESWVRLDFGDRVARGYCVGAALGASLLTLKVAQKMLNKQLEMM
jgi:hypothetical protein